MSFCDRRCMRSLLSPFYRPLFTASAGLVNLVKVDITPSETVLVWAARNLVPEFWVPWYWLALWPRRYRPLPPFYLWSGSARAMTLSKETSRWVYALYVSS